MGFNTAGAASGAAAGAALGPWGAVIGGLAGGFLGKQKAPKAAPLRQLDPQEEQRRAIEGDLANADSIEQLLSRTNRYNQNEASSLMELAVPGYGKLAQRFTSLAGDKLDNRYSVPKEVTDNLTRIAAERGINTGVRGQAGEFSLLRDLGVNMLDYGDRQTREAQSLFSTVAGLAPRVSPMSPLSFYVTPQQQMGATDANNSRAFSANQAQNNANAAAGNANASMWAQIIAQLGGLASGSAGESGKKKAAAIDI
jgi:hypothetical protein